MSAFVVTKKHIDLLVQTMLIGCTDSVAWPGGRHGREPFSWWHDNTRHRLSCDIEQVEGTGLGGPFGCEDVPPSILGQRLVDECVSSVSYRYPGDDVSAGELPGPNDAYYTRPYRFEPITPPAAMPPGIRRSTRLGSAVIVPVATTAEVAMALVCYEYQSCEHPAWSQSEANTIIQSLRRTLLAGLPGYQEAAWEWV